MSVNGLLAQLDENDVTLSLRGERLIVKGRKQALAPAMLALIRENRGALIELIKTGEYVSPRSGVIDVPPNRIPPGCGTITPEMLPLARLSATDIERIVSAVPGGATNVQDIYPLAPLQEGILFHHLMASGGDIYLAHSLYSVGDRAQLDAYLRALQAVIDRHDMLRTSIHWEGLPQPVQVVWRQASVVVEEARFDAAGGDVAEQLKARFDPRRYRLDVRQAPLMRVCVAEDAPNRRWVVLWLSHHLLSDPMTLAVIRREIQAHLLDEVALLPAPQPFRNFVAQARLGLSREGHEAFFRRMLGDVDESTAPFGLTDAHGDGSDIEAARSEVSAPLTRRLLERARALAVSVASLYHLAWALVLARTSGRDDVVFGTVLFGRMQGSESADHVVGLLMNTLPVRIRIGDESVEDGVRRTHMLLGQLMRHEHAPLSLAQRCSGVESPTPLFSALLNYRHNAGVAAALAHAQARGQVRTAAGKEIEFEELGELEKRTNYSLTLNVDDLGEKVALNAQAPSPIDPNRICAYMLRALEQLVKALEGAPTTPVRSLDVLPAWERRQMLVEWNATQSEYPYDRCAHELFEAVAADHSEAVAVAQEDRHLTYGGLNAEANRLARHLRSLGLRPEGRVAILLDRSMELVIAELAILKCGAAYAPLDQNAPTRRQAFIIEDCQAGLILTLKEAELPPIAGAARVDIDELTLEGQSADNLGMALDGEAAAYIMYTSGSSGEPKGVVVPHRAIGRLVFNNGYAEFEAGDRVAFAANPAFDATTMEVWAPLLRGGCMVVIEQATLLAPERFKWSLLSQGVNVMWLTVGLFNQYADSLADVFSGLRYLIVGGDALDARVMARVLSRSRPQHLVNGYGPTETTTFAMTEEIIEVAEGAKSIPIGRPIGNTKVYVLDRHGEPAPAGVAGEIYIGGAGVARGYLNRPEQTAELFVADPFAGEANARMYRSGDLGRYLPDGRIEYLGRNDFQVKVRGFRVELGEIEAKLAEHPAIREAVVVAREYGAGDKQLVAYYTTAVESGKSSETTEAMAGALRGHLSAALPEYMTPAAYVMLEALPLTPNGKIDRKALPAPEGVAYAVSGYEAPVGEIETALARVWAEALKVERVGRHDDFFDLGGHSLLAVRVVSGVRKALGLEVGVTELFLHPTLSEFAETVNNSARSELPPITKTSRDGPLALSFAQQRLWFLAQMEGVSQAYHMPFGLRVGGPLNREALRRALDRVVARHESLRSTFVQVDGQPVQRIAPEESGFALQEYDLRRHPDAAGELERLMAEEAVAPFDLEAGPLIRGRLIQLGAAEHALLVTMHHIVSDGWSMGVLTREFSALYRAFSEGQADPLPALEIQYADYAAWQRRWIAGEVLQAQADYWRRALAGAPALLTLPTDRPRPPKQDYAGAEVGLELDESLTQGLKALCQRHGATLFMTLLAAWGALLARLAGQDEVVIGVAVANRTRAEVEPLIGFFVNTLALRLDLSNNPTVSELLQRVKAQALAAQEHQYLPFEHVVEITRPPRSLAHSPLFQVMFDWQNNEAGAIEAPGLTLAPASAPQEAAKFDLTLGLFEADDRIVGGLMYATALFDRSTVERHLDCLRNMLQEMVIDDQQALAQLKILSPSERRQILVGWNATRTAYPHDQYVHVLFEARAAEHPDATAVVFEDCQLSYDELNLRANRVAHHLRKLGVRPDTRVGLCVERGLDMVVGLLAVLKAGGAYVPLDPAYPVERLAYMLEDSAPVVVLTHAQVQAPVYAAIHSTLAGVGNAAPVVDLQRDAESWESELKTDPDWFRVGLAPGHLAYVIYTSGSTGKPKGVMIQHQGVINLLRSMRDMTNVTSADCVLAVTTLAFDIAGLELFLPLVCGARIALADAARSHDPGALVEMMAASGATMAQATPATWRMLLEAGWGGAPWLKALCGGEALPVELAGRIGKRVGRLWNVYGPTETTIWSSASPVDASRAKEARASEPIGRPVANTRIYVLDGQGEPAPIGVAGEIYIGGAGVARGYLNRPELTAERFVADLFADEANARMYKSGDVGRYLADGAIEYLGRNDFQVKVRGFRIELSEIEARLAEHPGVKEAVVVAREESAGDRRLVAYYTESATMAVDAETLRAHVLKALPEYMAPAAYVRLPELPLTSNGKIDRKALPTPDREAYASRGYEAPVGEVEAALALIWAELLKLERVGRHDHFFDLGGHSLLATSLIQRMRRQGLQADVRALFAAPTLAELASVTERIKEIVL
jgi:amino acid adenylation domain-containing protein